MSTLRISILQRRGLGVNRTLKFSADGDVSVIEKPFVFSSEKKEVKNCYQFKYPDGSFEVMLLSRDYLTGGSKKMESKRVVSPEQKKSSNNYRACSNIRRLIKCNELVYHWVLTYKEAGKDRREVSKDFKKFIQRLNYSYGQKVPYVVVIELQKKREKKHNEKALHFHFVTSERIPFKKFQECWKNGFVLVKRHNGSNASKIASYLSKYLKKEIDEDGIRDVKQKRYFVSKGLKKPEKIEFYLTEEQKKELLKKAKEKGVYVKDILLTDGQRFGSWVSGDNPGGLL